VDPLFQLPSGKSPKRVAPVKLPHLDRVIPLLIKLDAVRWTAPVFLLLDRFAGIDDLIDSDDDLPEESIVQALGQLSEAVDDDTIATALSHLNCFTYRAKSPSGLWNPLEQSYRKFYAEAGGHVLVYQWDSEHPDPAIIQKWLIGCVNSRGV
jgi:hypothetical protein